MSDSLWASQSQSGQRFNFGKNWLRFKKEINSTALAAAKQSILAYVGLESLDSQVFFDIGSGSGLFSLAAYQLGARVVSIDFDPYSVLCTNKLRDEYCHDSSWHVYEGSVLDLSFLKSLGKPTIVYSWGVLHHTGNLSLALENITEAFLQYRPTFVFAIYNDQGFQSRLWSSIKRLYCSSIFARTFLSFIYLIYSYTSIFLSNILRFRSPFSYLRQYKSKRGMNVYIDLIDWLGGYPFEVLKPELIVHFMLNKGFYLYHLEQQIALVVISSLLRALIDD